MVTRIVDKKAGEFVIVTIASAVHVQLAFTLEGHDQSDLVLVLCMTTEYIVHTAIPLSYEGFLRHTIQYI